MNRFCLYSVFCLSLVYAIVAAPPSKSGLSGTPLSQVTRSGATSLSWRNSDKSAALSAENLSLGHVERQDSSSDEESDGFLEEAGDEIQEAGDEIEQAAEDGAEAVGDAFDGTDSDTDDDDEVCFPASARVRVEGKGLVAMSRLSVGDRVHVGNGKYSAVYMFSHRLSEGTFPFVKLSTEHEEIRLTAGHYIYADGQLTAAAHVRVGSSLETENGMTARVISAERVSAKGLYNPQTLDGDIVVDGIRASTYTRAVEPVVASSLLAPLRAVFRGLGFDVSGQCLETGAPKAITRFLPHGEAVSTY